MKVKEHATLSCCVLVLCSPAEQGSEFREDMRQSRRTAFEGLACSIAIGRGLTTAQPGSLEGLLMVVSDVKAVREELIRRDAFL